MQKQFHRALNHRVVNWSLLEPLTMKFSLKISVSLYFFPLAYNRSLHYYFTTGRPQAVQCIAVTDLFLVSVKHPKISPHNKHDRVCAMFSLAAGLVRHISQHNKHDRVCAMFSLAAGLVRHISQHNKHDRVCAMFSLAAGLVRHISQHNKHDRVCAMFSLAADLVRHIS